MMKIYQYIDLREKGISSRKAAELSSISRTTGEKYYSKFKEKRSQLIEEPTDQNKRDFIEKVLSRPVYDSSSRKPRKYSDEIDQLLNRILEDEEEKTRLLGASHKQQLTCSQIHQLILEEGYEIGLSTVTKKVHEKRKLHKECFIAQEYDPGDRFEYDFGEVKLLIDGQLKRYYLAVMTSPWSGYRAAYLYENQKSQVFYESMIRFFNEVGGCFKEGVFDNMRNVVSKFIGRNEKEINEELIRFAHYYGFKVNVTNAFSGNEKGSVERSVEIVRNRSFALRYKFESLDEARQWLSQCLVKLNDGTKLEEERPYLSTLLPDYESAFIEDRMVNKYSLIKAFGNQYSVPERLVGEKVRMKAYSETIEIYFEKELVARHERAADNQKKTCFDIRHYLSTLRKKPGSLQNSAALKEDPELYSIYEKYFNGKPREFIEILLKNQGHTMAELKNDLRSAAGLTVGEEKVYQPLQRQVQSYNELFI